MKSSVLDKAYSKERNASVKERLLRIIRISTDKQHIELVASELHKSRAWAYKWYKRYNEEGLEGLRDKPRSGRPSFMDEENIVKIRKELSASNTGWSTKEVMDLIQKKTGIKYHEDHIRRLLYQWEFGLKAPEKRFVKRASDKEIKDFKKG
ncbi:MAG: helix-turn-helix domain-containing protein [Candidatus Nitrosocosmicus sp.]|nr:helix-turn-helix domain-containing protein [Candidatus Nitrosocosmicus sp.]MDN5868370.1 helix-turn-helix domain-containing protein [Candidatus Nitrosocosmicus sp.]